VVGAEDLGRELIKLLSDDAEREGRGARAAYIVAEQRGATDRILTGLKELLATDNGPQQREVAPA
jgi:hypothetical protein